MHGARAALCDTAAEFRAGQTDHVAQHPEERRIGLDIDLSRCSVDFDCDHRGSPRSKAMMRGLLSKHLVSDTEAAGQSPLELRLFLEPCRASRTPLGIKRQGHGSGAGTAAEHFLEVSLAARLPKAPLSAAYAPPTEPPCRDGDRDCPCQTPPE